MRLLFFGDNWLGWQVARWLREQGEEIVAAVLHPPARRRYGAEICESLRLAADVVLEARALMDADGLSVLRRLAPEMGVSVLFGYLLRREVLGLMPAGCINLHPALLPYNRGGYPNVWSIVEGTAAGVTVHYIDEGIDTGDIIAQRKVAVLPTDTGETLYRRLEREALDLFVCEWPAIRSGRAERHPQDEGAGTYHRRADVELIDEIHLDRTYRARELIDIIRARTFPPYSGAYFRWDGRKIFLRLQLMEEGQLNQEQRDEPRDRD